MGQPVVHFEIIGKDADKLRAFYGALFDWQFDLSASVSAAVSESTNYGFIKPGVTPDGLSIPGGVGGGAAYEPSVIFYVGVANVETALQKAESLGGTRKLGPERAPGRDLVVGQFSDPEGNVVGVAGAA